MEPNTTPAAVEYIISGRADSIDFARAERVAQMSEAALPHFRVSSMAFHPEDWERSPNAKEATGGVVVRTSGSVVIGGVADLERAIEHKYGVRWEVPDELAREIARENMADAELKHRDALDEIRMNEEADAAKRGTAFREWMRGLRASIETWHLKQARDLCTAVRMVRASTAALEAEFRSLEEKEDREQKEGEQKYDQVQQPNSADPAAKPAVPPPEAAPAPAPPASEVPPPQPQPTGIAVVPTISVTEPSQPAPLPPSQPLQPPPKPMSPEMKKLLELASFEAAFQQCKPFPLEAVRECSERIRAGARALPTPDPLWSTDSSKWLTWHQVTASSFDYLEAQCREGEELRTKIGSQLSEHKLLLRERISASQPMTPHTARSEPFAVATTYSHQLCQQLRECTSSATRLYKQISSDARELAAKC